MSSAVKTAWGKYESHPEPMHAAAAVGDHVAVRSPPRWHVTVDVYTGSYACMQVTS